MSTLAAIIIESKVSDQSLRHVRSDSDDWRAYLSETTPLKVSSKMISNQPLCRFVSRKAWPSNTNRAAWIWPHISASALANSASFGPPWSVIRPWTRLRNDNSSLSYNNKEPPRTCPRIRNETRKWCDWQVITLDSVLGMPRVCDQFLEYHHL